MAFAASTNPIVAPLTSRDTQVADTGNLFVATNPTPGTAIVGPVSTTFNQTIALFLVYNGGNLTIYPTALRMKVTSAGTGGTTVRFDHRVDTGNRYSSSVSGNTLTGNPTSASHVYARGAASDTITATATDEDGTWNANSSSV